MEIRIDKEILKDAVLTWGTDAQIDMAIEECSELINALEKFKRGRVEIQDVATEIADVQIMCAQMEIIFDGGSMIVEDERKRKMERLHARLEKYKNQDK